MIDSDSAIEDAVAEYADLSQDEYRKLKGRGKVNIQKAKTKQPPVFNHETQQLEAPMQGEVARLSKQCRRLLQIKGCTCKLVKARNATTPIVDSNTIENLQKDIDACIKAFQHNTKAGDDNIVINHHFNFTKDYNYNPFLMAKIAHQIQNDADQGFAKSKIENL